MNLTLLRVLTWGTVAGAVVSALLLASGESGLPEWSHRAIGDAVSSGRLPQEPPAAAPGDAAEQTETPPAEPAAASP